LSALSSPTVVAHCRRPLSSPTVVAHCRRPLADPSTTSCHCPQCPCVKRRTRRRGQTRGAERGRRRRPETASRSPRTRKIFFSVAPAMCTATQKYSRTGQLFEAPQKNMLGAKRPSVAVSNLGGDASAISRRDCASACVSENECAEFHTCADVATRV
jgi:hypothetical protein